MTKKALITGIFGQDGTYLAEHLLSGGYQVHGLARQYADPLKSALPPELKRALNSGALVVHAGDILRPSDVQAVIANIQPNEVYNLAAQSHVGRSFEDPKTTIEVNSLGALNVITAILNANPSIRLFQAGSCDMFGDVAESPQSENTPFHPRSPYGSSKLLAHQLVQQYRQSSELKGWNGILYPHESPRRSGFFVTRKVTLGIADIIAGETDVLYLGNLDAQRDWGSAEDTVRAMWMMLLTDEPEDYVVATGEVHSVRTLVQDAFEMVGLKWQEHVQTDPMLYRPLDPKVLIGDASKLQRASGWRPTKRFNATLAGILYWDLKSRGLNIESFPRLLNLMDIHPHGTGGSRQAGVVKRGGSC